jgi:hypothetical protein
MVDMEGDRIAFLTSPGSRKARNLAREPRVAFSVTHQGKVSFASPLQANAPSDTNVTITNNITNPGVPTYDCAGRYVYLAGELSSKTSSVTSGSSVTLTAIVQPTVSGSAAPTGTISILEGTTVVASGPVAGRLTYLTVPSVSTGVTRTRHSTPGTPTTLPSASAGSR